MSEAVFSEEQYKSFEKALIKNEFSKVFALMNAIPDLQNSIVHLRSRLTRHNTNEAKGIASREELELTFNKLINSIQNLVEPYKPLIEDSSEARPSSTNSPYAFNITSPKDGKLRRTQEILGRDEKIKEIYPLLGEKAPALLLKGEGGIGKTDFCKILLEKYLEDNPDTQVWWIDVEYMDSVESLVGTLALSLGLAETTARATVLAKFSEQPALYYLDNLESITDAKTASDFLSQLTTINNVYWLASSRSKINNWKTETIEELDANAALQVFLNQWANSSGEELELPQAELAEFIDKDLGFHPLSIILAASRGADYFDVSEVIAAWKAGEATVREKEASDAGHRLNNLDLSLELSYNALKDPYAKQLWAICAFFPQGMGKEDLKYFVEKRDFPLSARAELIKRSILRNKGGKLTLLPPFADFMKRKLEGEEEAVFVENSLGFCLEHAREDLVIHPLWLSRMPYIFEFLKYGVDRIEEYPELWRLYEKMFNDWNKIIFIGKEILEKILDNDFLNKKESYKADCTLYLGEIEFRIGENDKAKSLFIQAEKIYNKIGNERGRANVLAELGEVEFRIGENDKAKSLFMQAGKIYEKIGDEQDRANNLTRLGKIEFRIGENDKAKSLFIQAERIYERTNSDHNRAIVLVKLGKIELRIGENDKAKSLFMQAVKIYEKIGDDLIGRANVLVNLGEIELKTGKNAKAKGLFIQAGKIYEKMGDKLGRANVFTKLGEIELKVGKIFKIAKAKNLFRQAYRIYEKIGDEQGRVNILINLGRIECYIKNYLKGFQFFKKSLRRSKEYGYITGELITLLELGKYSGIQKDKADVIKYFTAAKEISNKLGIERNIRIVKRMEAEALKNCE